MNHATRLTRWTGGSLISAVAVILLAGCQSGKEPSGAGTATVAAPAAPAMTAPATPPGSTSKAIRIDAGSDTNYVDSEGNTWLADQGFADGEVTARDDGHSDCQHERPGNLSAPSITT